ncbi:MAG TPA: ribonuclease HI family protein [Actinomycetota bacterium]|nr:ribonuclease HI family protein [Actinomycetota bacterium]
MRASLHADGGARGNPGPAGIGVVLKDSDDEVIGEIAASIGEATNNVAEYSALIAGLEMALAKGVTEVDVFMDSELVVSQLKGEWKIKNDRLRTLAVRARSLLNRFEQSSLQHVRREMNSDADKLANQGMDAAMLDWDAEKESPGQQSFLE